MLRKVHSLFNPKTTHGFVFMMTGQTAQRVFRTRLFLNISLTAVGLIHAPMFCVGDEFKNYADLKEKIHGFERAEFLQLKVQRSRLIDSASKVYNEDLQYAEIDFVCARERKIQDYIHR